MLKWTVWFPLKLLGWALGLIGAFALLLAAMVAMPLKHPPELRSVSQSRKSVDYATLPAIERFQARDGTMLGFRHYPPSGPATGRAAIVIHGSSGSSGSPIHALSGTLAARGIDTWAIDIRGHGASGTRGDIAYVGQLEDDLADFVADIRKTAPTVPLTLIGHSSGGGFALRVASFADPEPVRPLCAACALSRLRRADQPAELRRLGQRRHSAHSRTAGAAQTRRRLLRGAADAGLRGAAEFSKASWFRSIPTG